MTYKQELEERYRQARARMRMGVKAPIVPSALLAAAAIGGVSGGTGVIPPLVSVAEFSDEPLPELSFNEPDAEQEAQEAKRRETFSNAVVNKVRMEAQISKMPRLKPLPKIDMNSCYSKWKQVVAGVAENYGIEAADILGPSRKRLVIQARFECMYRMRTDLHMSFPSIGEKVNRDHSTVMHGVNTILHRLLDEKARQRQSGGRVIAQGTSLGASTHLPELSAA